MSLKYIAILKNWVLPILNISLIFVTIYASVQFLLRSNANDPQI